MKQVVPCLTHETAARLVAGDLAEPEIATVDEHLDSCTSCRDLVAAAALASGTVSRGADRGELHTNPQQEGRLIADRYEIRGCLGMGTMGVVYTCYDRKLRRIIAVKSLRSSGGEHEHRVEDEARAMAQVHHPHVVDVYDVGTDDGELFVVMEQVHGESLRRFCERAPPVRTRLSCLAQAARGLGAAHQAGVVHRDVKPDNIFVGDNGTVKIGDFGLARERDADLPELSAALAHSTLAPSQTATRLTGTPAYMAPELLRGQRANARSDQFAFAVTAWETLFGVRPFGGSTLIELRTAIETKTPKPPLNTQVPATVITALLRALSNDPAKRFATTDALAAAIDPPAPRRSRAPLLLLGVGLALALPGFYAISRYRTANQSAITDPCASAGASFDQAFADASAAQARFTALDAGETFATLVRYRERGKLARENVCHASKTRGVQSDALFDARMRCLDGQESAYRTLAEATAAVTRETVGNFALATAGLSDPEACVTSNALSARDPIPPAKLQLAKEIVAAAEQLRVQARLTGAATPPASTTQLLTRAAELDHAPTSALVHAVQAEGLRQAAHYDEADQASEASIADAERGHDDWAAAEAWILRLGIAGDRRELSRAELWLPLARAAVARAGDPPELAAKVATSAGLFAMNRGNLALAKTELKRALSLRSTRIGTALDIETARIHSALGHVARLQEDLPLAENEHREALRVDRILLGTTHPDVGRDLHNLAGILRLRGNLVEAQSNYLEAIAIRLPVLGAQHPEIALTENSLGLIALEQGNFSEAKSRFQAALTILEAAHHEDAALAHENLVRTLVALHEPRKALEHADAAQVIELRQHPQNNPRLATMLAAAADAADSVGQDRRAYAYRITAQRVLGADDPALRQRLSLKTRGDGVGPATALSFSVHSARSTAPQPLPSVTVLAEPVVTTPAATGVATIVPPVAPPVALPAASIAPVIPAAPTATRPRNESYGSTQAWP